MQAHTMPRSDRLAALGNRAFDLLVIGGGITGCGIARDAALRGLSVALVEKDDFASGTSSRSSRLIHGGVRYLEHGHLHLVFESSAERRRLLRLAPHLVQPLLFTWPVYEGARIPRWKLGAGLTLYDMLAMFRNFKRHVRLNRDGILRMEPMVKRDGLRGGAQYWDAATNDARLTLANAAGAADAGAIVVNHCAVNALRTESGRVTGAAVRDVAGTPGASVATIEVRATVVVNATGPWSDEIRSLDPSPDSGRAQPRVTVRGSKGAHIAVPRNRVRNSSALTLLSPIDGRVVFVLPGDTLAIVGTTDTYTTSSPDQVRATRADVQYLLDSANAFFPEAKLTNSDVVSAWAGIRPLLPAAGDAPGAASREHAIVTSAAGMISITGGKLTTYRIMAAQVVDAVVGRLKRAAAACTTDALPLPGGDFETLIDLAKNVFAVVGEEDIARYLARSYGTRWTEMASELSAPGGLTRLVSDLPYTLGEIRFSAREEMVVTLGDLLIRRTHIAYETPDHGIAVAEQVAETVAPPLGWDAARQRRAVADYAVEVARLFAID